MIGIVVDAIYQWKVFKTFYPVEALIVALLLACVASLTLLVV